MLKALKPTCTVNNPEKVLPVLPVPEVVSVLDVRVVLEWEDVHAHEVDEVCDGQCGQVSVGGGSHTAPRQHHDGNRVAEHADQHNQRLQHALDPEPRAISKHDCRAVGQLARGVRHAAIHDWVAELPRAYWALAPPSRHPPGSCSIVASQPLDQQSADFYNLYRI